MDKPLVVRDEGSQIIYVHKSMDNGDHSFLDGYIEKGFMPKWVDDLSVRFSDGFCHYSFNQKGVKHTISVNCEIRVIYANQEFEA